MKFLLLQARNPGDEAAPHEQVAFRDVLDLMEEELTPWDLLRGPPSWKLIEAHDCVLVGGSGEYGVNDSKTHTWLKQFIDFCGELAGRGSPMFASCFGFQALVVAAGGTVEQDKSRAEVGTFPLRLTVEGKNDLLFKTLPVPFYAQFGHKDHALDMPAGLINLAATERCPHQALRVEGKPIYATQFHPELSMTRNRERYMRYIEAYADPEMADTVEEVMARFQDTHHATDLLRRYVVEVLGPLL